MAACLATARGRSLLLISSRLHSSSLFCRLTADVASGAIDRKPVVVPSILPATRASHTLCSLKRKMVNETAASDSNGHSKPSGEEQLTCQEIQIPMPFGHLAGKTHHDLSHFSINNILYSFFYIAKVWGKPNNNPILALHGWQDNAGTFDKLIPMLPSNSYIVCLDFVGKL